MVYLFADDIPLITTSAFWQQISDGDTQIQNMAEAWALGECAQRLAGIDAAQVLAPWRAFDSAVPYPAGTRVLDGLGQRYVALRDAAAGSDLGDATTWEQRDARPPGLVVAVLQLTLWRMACRFAPQDVPPAATAARAEALAWLLGQREGTLLAAFTKANGSRILYGQSATGWGL